MKLSLQLFQTLGLPKRSPHDYS